MELRADGQVYPLNVPLSSMTEASKPTELLSLQYKNANMNFAVYAEQPAKTRIVIAADGTVVGYYLFGSDFQIPDDCSSVDYIDNHPQGTGKTYARLIMKDGYTIRFASVADKSDFSPLAKLNFYATNGIRAVNGLKVLKWDAYAAKASLSHSEEMAKLNYFDHSSYDGTKFSARLESFGADWSACAENIDCGYTDPFSALNGWYNSLSGHRENILSSKYTNMGVGFAYGENSDYQYYGTQDFYKGW